MMALAIRMQVFGTTFPFKLDFLPDTVELSFRKKKRELTQHYRAIAKEAIARLYSESPNYILDDTKYYLTLTNKFKCCTSEKEGDYDVTVKWLDDMLDIEVKSTKEDISEPSIIKITPFSTWTMPVPAIQLKVYSRGWLAVTAAWKVLDRTLMASKTKADLVQLNGYYQYQSQIVCTLKTSTLDKVNIMLPIINGEIVGKELTSTNFAKAVKINEDEVLEHAKWLRTLGYEIRNSHTNPQIPQGVWLLPYKFPSLLPESVQLNKTLE